MVTQLPLSRREREIVEILFRLGEASVAEVLAAMRSPPSYSAVRALLRLLEEKGHASHRRDGRRYVYRPTMRPSRARRSAVRHLIETFYSGSVERCVAAIIDQEGRSFTDEELDRLSELIEKARQKDDTGGAS